MIKLWKLEPRFERIIYIDCMYQSVTGL